MIINWIQDFYQYPRLSGQKSFVSDDAVEDVLPDVRVDGRERIVQQVDVGLPVNGAS
jgi:hypothetical protein